MPRAIDPALLSRGGGLASRRSVEASAFVHPTQGLDGLIAHITDPRAAHMAQMVAIVDAGGYYASDDVEGALQEVASSASSTGQNGVIQGGTYAAAGLNVTLATPTIVRVNGTDRDLSGAMNTLANNNTSWLYVDGSSGTLMSSVGAAPSITSPEHVLLARITTSGGAITVSKDARWFVRNLDRKLPLTIRASGTEADRNSEASFESIDAALLYLTTFGGSGVIRNYTLIIKGDLTVSAPLVIPVDGVTLQGEDGCNLITGAGVAPMIDVSSRANIRIRDIDFTADHAASTAIGCPSGGAITDVVIERCSFTSGISQWVTGIDFDVAGPQIRVVVRDCNLTATTYGVRMREPANCRLVDTSITETGGAGTAAFHLGSTGGGIGSTTDSMARNVIVKGFDTGGIVRGVRMRVESCDILDSDLGLSVLVDSSDVTIIGTTVELDATNGLVGVRLDGDNIRVTSCRIYNSKDPATYAAEVPLGIDVLTGVDSVHIMSCQIIGFLNTTTPGGIGLQFAGTSAGSVVEGNSIEKAHVGIAAVGVTDRLRIVGCSILDVQTGMSLQGDTVVDGTKISLDSSRGLVGIDIFGNNVQVADTHIHNPRGAGTYGITVPLGIRINTVNKISLSDLDIEGFYNSAGSGSFIVGIGSCSDIIVSGGVMDKAWTGIAFAGGENHILSSITMKECQTAINVSGTRNIITGCTLDVSTTYGVEGIHTVGTDTVITGCVLTNARGVYAGETPTGISLNGENAKVTGCLLRGWRNAGGSLGYASRVLIGASQITFQGNTVETCWTGFQTDAGAGAGEIIVTDNTFRDIDRDPIFLANADAVRVSGNTLTLVGNTNGIQVANGEDVEVTNNRILGASVTQTGILLIATVADRCRRFVISGNTVASCTADGILLSGYVQNGVVTGNTVDNYLPGAQYDPTAAACIRVAGSGAADLGKYISIVGNTCLRSRSGIVITGIDISNLAVGITVKGNIVHHCAIGQAGSVPGVGIDANWTRDLVVEGNNIHRIGIGINNSDVEGSPTAGPFSFSVGIRVRGSSVTQIAGNTVADLTTNGVGATSTGIVFSNAATVLTFDARDIAITGNQVVTRDVLPEMTNGILVESGDTGVVVVTSIANLLIANNTIRWVLASGILVTSADESTLRQVSVIGNTISRCTDGTLGRGIQFVAETGAPGASGIIREADISENTIGSTGDSGILISAQSGTSFSGISIRNNNLAGAGNHAIEVSADTPTSFSTLVADGNTVTGSANEALFVSFKDYAPTNLSISQNSVLGVHGAASVGAGISITTTRVAVNANDVTALSVTGNRIHTTTTHGIYVDLDGTLHDAVFSGNLVQVNSTSETLYIASDPVNVVGGETYMDNVAVTGNTFVGGTGTNFSVGHGVKVRNLTFTGNAVRTSSTYGFSLYTPDATVGAGDAVYGIVVADNVFDDIDAEAVRIFLGDTVTEIDTCANISVTGNQFTNCNTAGVTDEVVFVRGLGLIRNLSVSHNTFRQCGAIEAEDSGTIRIALGVNGAGAAGRNIAIVENSFESCTGVGILVDAHTAASTYSVYDLRVDKNNNIAQTNDAIRLFFADFTDVVNVSVSHNLIQDISDSGGLLSDTGISFLGPSTATIEVTQVSIIGNTIRNTGNNNVGGGIQVSILEDIADLAINDNVVALATGNLAGIYVTVDGLWRNGTLIGNTVSSSTEDGIHLKMTGDDAATSGIRGVAIANNSVTGAGNDGIAISSAVNVSTPVFDNIVVSGNVIEDVARHGINLSCQNLNTVSVTGNTVNTVVGHGVVVTTVTDAFGLNVSNNTIRNWSGDAALTNYGGIYLDLASANTDDVAAVVVADNSLWSDNTYSRGLWLNILAAIDGMIVSDNMVQLNNAGNTSSLLFATGLGTQAGLSIVGNTFRRAVTGVAFSGTFGPTASVCANNIERTGTGAGAGAWAAFTAAFGALCIIAPNQD